MSWSVINRGKKGSWEVYELCGRDVSILKLVNKDKGIKVSVDSNNEVTLEQNGDIVVLSLKELEQLLDVVYELRRNGEQSYFVKMLKKSVRDLVERFEESTDKRVKLIRYKRLAVGVKIDVILGDRDGRYGEI